MPVLTPSMAKCLIRPGADAVALLRTRFAPRRIISGRRKFLSALDIRRSRTHVPSTLFFIDTHPNIWIGEQVLSQRPCLTTELQGLISAVCPYIDPWISISRSPGGTCGSDPMYLDEVFSTVNGACGFAEGLAHELAHQKLRAVGVTFDNGGDILRNLPSHVGPSPIRTDVLRPFPAILHAQYSYVYVLYVQIAACKLFSEGAAVSGVLQGIELNVSRLDFGVRVIDAGAKPSEQGEIALAVLWSWYEELRCVASELLSAHGRSVKAFVHPITGSSWVAK